MSSQIVGLCVAKNESDIIEAMVRHNLGYLDALHVVDNDSADATPDILSALAAEFPGRLTWEIDRRLGHVQTAIVNACLVPLMASTDAAQIVLLDADEFLRADRAVFREALEAQRAPVLLPWVGYVPTASDNRSLINPVERITHRRRKEKPQLVKSTVPGHLVGKARIAPGNHALKGEGAEPAVQIEGLTLAHFPVRSAEQLTSKILIGAWNMRLRTRRARNEGYHWHSLAERLMAGEVLTDADLQSVALTYAAHKEARLVLDPLVPEGTAPLRYTPDGAIMLIRNLAAFTESCVRRLEGGDAATAR